MSEEASWLISTATSWVSRTADSPKFAELGIQLSGAAVAARANGEMVRLDELIGRANSLFAVPVIDLPAWTRALTELQGEVHALLTEPLRPEPELKAARDRLATWYADASSNGGQWCQASAVAVRDAVARERLWAAAPKWLFVIAALCFFGGIAGGCVGSVTAITSQESEYDPATGYQRDPVTIDDPGSSTIILSILSVLVSIPILIAAIVLRVTRRDWTRLVRLPPPPKIDPMVPW